MRAERSLSQRAACALALTLALGVLSGAGVSHAQGAANGKLDPVLRGLLARNDALISKGQGPLDLDQLAGFVEARDGRVGVLVRRTTASLDALRGTGAQVGAAVGQVVTARATLAQLQALAALAGVVKLEPSLKLTPTRAQSAPGFLARPENDLGRAEVGADDLHAQGITGEGVIIGVIDTGIDYDHLDFRAGGGGELGARILAIWDQTCELSDSGPTPDCGPGASTVPGGFSTGGGFYDQSDVETDIANGHDHTTGLVFENDGGAFDFGHGTHVTGSAAGDGSSTGAFGGMAPDADVVFVKTNFFNTGILEAAQFIFDQADGFGRPAVINMSLGGHFGPHDGTSNFDAGLTALLGGPGRALVAAAGNEGNDLIHASAALAPGESADLVYDSTTVDTSQKAWDCWYDGSASLEATVSSPNGDSNLGPIATGAFDFVDGDDGSVDIDNASSGADPLNGDHELFWILRGTDSDFAVGDIAAGDWTLSLENTGSVTVTVHCWRFSDGFGAGAGTTGYDNDFSVGSPATANDVIAVGAFATRETWTDADGSVRSFGQTDDEITTFSSLGPTRDGRTKPEIAAPGTAIISALSEAAAASGFNGGPIGDTNLDVQGDSQHFVLQGTSMASPHVAGAVALAFEIDPTLTASELIDGIEQTAKADSFTGSTPNNTWGAGKLDVSGFPSQFGSQGSDPTSAVFLVDNDGNVSADRAYHGASFNSGSGADLAEGIRSLERLQPGDVVELDPALPGFFRKSRGTDAVAGVISTQPGMTLGDVLPQSAFARLSLEQPLIDPNDLGRELSLGWSVATLAQPRVLLALAGRVPVKVTAENGPIRPGDLLTPSPTRPGHAMRCSQPCTTAIIGKALEALAQGQGTVEMLILRP